MMTKKMWERISGIEGLHRLDLSDEEDRNYYLERMGGKEKMKREYPVLYAAYKKGVERHREKNEITVEPHLEFINPVDVEEYLREDGMVTEGEQGLYRLKTTINLDLLDVLGTPISPEEPRKFQVDIAGEIFDKNSHGMSFMGFSDSVAPTNKYSHVYKSQGLYRKEQYDNRLLTVYAEINIYDEENVLDPYIFTQDVQFGMEKPIQNLIFEAPYSKYSNNEIRILYGRDATNLSDPDYIYKSNCPEGDLGKLRTIIPIRGSVELKSSTGKGHYYSFKKLTEHPKESPLHFKRSTLNYHGEEWKIFFKEKDDEQLYKMMTDPEKPRFTVEKKENHGDILKFDLFHSGDPKDDNYYNWEDGFEKVNTDQRERVCYLSGGFEYDIETKRAEDDKVIRTKAYQIQCISVDPDQLQGNFYFDYVPGSQLIYIPPIKLWWGCHARDTEITMADGTKQRADRVQIGDRLPVYGDRILTVNNIYTGYEKELFQIQTDAGKTLKISIGHPLLREDGTAVPAEEIRTGDVILAEDGRKVSVTRVEKCLYEDEVYNFSFEGEEKENYVVAEGIYSGDLYAQNKRSGKKKQPTKEQMTLLEEMKRLRHTLPFS